MDVLVVNTNNYAKPMPVMPLGRASRPRRQNRPGIACACST
ncbi:MAG TPA: hypothetical protein VM186_12970 [Planctomycetota bacterium]|nr:hypothetical protein [Planctomycetota bacterium]